MELRGKREGGRKEKQEGGEVRSGKDGPRRSGARVGRGRIVECKRQEKEGR